MEIIVEEQGCAPVVGDLVVVGEDVYEIAEHLGLHHAMGAAAAPGSGRSNYWRYEAKPTGLDIWDYPEEEYSSMYEAEEEEGEEEEAELASPLSAQDRFCALPSLRREAVVAKEYSGLSFTAALAAEEEEYDEAVRRRNAAAELREWEAQNREWEAELASQLTDSEADE
jgi:hypothetical protein